jgi:hypothetical protein
VVAQFDDPQVEVKVEDILICSSVTKEDASEVVLIELAPTRTGTFDADSSAKQLEISDVRLTATPCLVWCLPNGGVHKAIM